jgi:hypothetical protein
MEVPVAEQVGRTVRRTMIHETGVAPEQLPTAQDIRIVEKGINGVLLAPGKRKRGTRRQAVEGELVALDCTNSVRTNGDD